MNDSRFHRAVQARIGTVLGSYRITEPISAGGMGAVYRAQHSLLGKSAAVKLLRPDLTDNHELVARFFNEAKAASAIRHPGIIEVFDFGYTEDGQAYLCMELLDGEPLSQRLQNERFDELTASVIARGIAGALGAAHAKGIIHRDLKPDNIFLVPDPDVSIGERPKLLDFGIAKLADARGYTQTGALIGTPLYMAPEQAKAATNVDHRADLYSLGCILYEMIVGEPPFLAEGAGEIIAMQMFATAQAPSARGITVSHDLEAITMRLLAKEPDERYQSAHDVVQALSAVVGKSPRHAVSARGSTPALRVEPTETPLAQQVSPTFDPSGPIPRRPLILDERPHTAPSRSLMPAALGALLVISLLAVGIWFLATRNTSAADPKPAPIEPPPTPVKVAPDTPAPQPPAPTPPPPPAPSPAPVKTKKLGVVPAPAPAPTAPVTHIDQVDHPVKTGAAVTVPPSEPTPNGPVTDQNHPIEDRLEE